MLNRYKVVLSSRNIYKEIDLSSEFNEIKVGTETDCDFRLHKDLFFEKIQLSFIQSNGTWSIMCSDNLYLDIGDVRKLLTKQMKHGEVFTVKYQNSENAVFSVEFLIDFDNGQRKYERAIDISAVSSVKIGVGSNNNIVISSPYVQNDSVELMRVNDGFKVHIYSTTYGVYHNGSKAVGQCVIKNGDFFSVSDFIFYYKNGVLWTEIRTGLLVNGLACVDYPNPNDYPKFSRNTRIKSVICKDEIEVLDPPAKPQKPKNNLFMNLLPSLGMLLASGVMAFMGGGMIVFSIISGAMAIVTSVLGVIQGNKDYKREVQERKDKYTKYAEDKRTEVQQIRNSERDLLEKIYLPVNSELSLFRNFSSDLFDRMSSDEDFLKVRIGTGSVEAQRKINYKKQERIEVEDDLQLIPEKISADYKYIDNVPVICDFKKSNAVGIIGDESNRFSILKNIIIDICARQYYTELKLVFVAESENRDKVEWLRFLPYVNNDASNLRNIVCDDDSKNIVFDYLYKELSQREQGKKGEHIVVFFYDDYGIKSHPLSKFIPKASELSVTFVFMADTKGLVPTGCDFLISLESAVKGYLIDTSDQNKTTIFDYTSVDNATAQQIVDMLAPVYTEEISLEGTLTKNISLFELLNILIVEDIDLEKRWNSSRVYQTMSAPVGVSKAGVVCLDLHDKFHGPHGLVAGTTGSGKSEILQTYILSIATIFHPYEVSFVIIDFKGGGMVNQFKNLPHLLGAITNIDGKEIDRSLKSIKAELQKRQRLFAEAEVNHIDKYIQKFKNGQVNTPIPHLILIVDEFAELKAEQPEFMKELISAARIGRSLGVHLILATQKPSGQVDEQIWSNSKFKLCLKVQSQEDSNEVLKSPLAAEIKEPGRAYLQVGNNEIFELFQSAYSGAPEKMDDNSIKEFKIHAFTESGRKVPIYVQKKKKSSGANKTQLEAIVDHIDKYCENNSIERLPSICLPSLPRVIDYPDVSGKINGSIDIGLFDDPDNQLQGSALLDIDNKNTLIIGSSQYGKTNLLQNIIRTIATSGSSDESAIYIIDFGSMVLRNFSELKHVGGVVTSSEDEKLKNLFKLLFEEIQTRKEKLMSVGVSSFSSYLEAGYKDMPHIYLIIDNLTALIELYLEDDDSLLNIVREGIAVGISTIIANAQTSGIGFKYLSNFANKVCLYCNDNNEYCNLFDRVKLQPDEVPGRCIFELDKRVLECQTYLAFNGEKEIERVHAMQEFIAEANSMCVAEKVRLIPSIPSVLTIQTLSADYRAVAEGYKIPVGLTYNEVTPFYLDISQLGIIGLCGKENTGHRNFIEYMVNMLEDNRDLFPVRMVIFDDVSRKFGNLKTSPIVDTYTLSTDVVSEILQDWYMILEERYNCLIEDGTIGNNTELLLMLVQNNDVARKINDDFDLMNQFTDMVNRFKGMNVAFVFSNYTNASVSYDAPEPLRMIKQDQHLIFFEDLDNLKPFDVPYEELKANRKRLETGDAYYIQDNTVTKLKVVKANDEE